MLHQVTPLDLDIRIPSNLLKRTSLPFEQQIHPPNQNLIRSLLNLPPIQRPKDLINNTL